MSRSPSVVTNFCNDASKALAAGKPDEAIELLEMALAADPNYGPVFRIWGQALIAKGDELNAFRFFEKAVLLSPLDFSARYCLARSYAWRDDKDKMLQELKTAIIAGIKVQADLRGLAYTDKGFKDFKQDHDFLDLVFPAPLELEEMILAYWDENVNQVINLGNRMLEDPKITDKIAVITLMLVMIRRTLADPTEDPDTKELDEKIHTYYKKLETSLRSRRKALRAAGAKSDFWKKFKLDKDPETDLDD